MLIARARGVTFGLRRERRGREARFPRQLEDCQTLAQFVAVQSETVEKGGQSVFASTRMYFVPDGRLMLVLVCGGDMLAVMMMVPVLLKWLGRKVLPPFLHR